MYSTLLAMIYLAFVSLGLPDSLVGAGWPVMHGDLGVPTSYAGIITMLIAVGTIVSSLQSDRLTRRFGTGVVTTTSVALTAAALIGFSTASEFWMLLIWTIPYGLGAGAVDAALNNYVALHYSSRHMSWLHSCWGVGAAISPFIMSYSLTQGLGWSSGFRVVGLIQIIITFLLLAGIPLWNKVNPPVVTKADDSDEDVAAAGPHISVAQALKIRGVPFVLAAFFTYCAIEATTILWASTFLVQDRAVAATTAASFASLFLIGITAGRFLSGFIADRVGDRGMIRLGTLLVGVGVVLIMIPLENDGLALAGLVTAGFGCAPIYPSIIHSTPTNFGRHTSHAIIGIQMAAAYLGSTLMPPLFGFIAQGVGMWLFPFYLALLAVVMFVMSELLNRSVGRVKEATPV
ncbi:MFS transporter [Actinomyces minihominis]|uniref:MFS transporter n=1 Tax=Actinomyces minihominis TaxID=2002838 RepID=UPI001A912B74|nr:MFS transporter [Actinomyces minihominis]